MTHTHKFDYWISDQVVIIAINQPGKVINVIVDGLNIIYLVQYWWEGKINEIKLDSEDLRDKA